MLKNPKEDQSPVVKEVLEVFIYDDEKGGYNAAKNRHDLALLRIEKIEYNDQIQPACFPHNFRTRSKKLAK